MLKKLALEDVVKDNEALLIHELAKQYIKQFDEQARKLGLTRTQWQCLRMLRRNPGIRQTDLAERLEIAPMSLVHLLDRMEKKKWCRRVIDKTDKRVRRVYLDTRVESHTSHMRNLALDLRSNALFGFSRGEHKLLVSYLQRLRDNLNSIQTPLKIGH